MIIQNNTFYNNVQTGSYGNVLHVYPGATSTAAVTGLTFTGNKIISRATTQLEAYMKVTGVNMSTFGTWNNNYWCRPAAENTSTFNIVTSGTVVTGLAGWRSFSGQDAASLTSPVTITDLTKLVFFYNATNTTTSTSLGGTTYKDVTNLNYSGTLNLAPYTSVVLIQTSAGGSNALPVSNAGTDQTITLPTNSVTLSGSATDADGTVASYAWVKVSGPTSFNIVNPAAASTLVNNLAQGVYQFRLDATDNLGAVGSDQVQVTVNSGANLPPVSNSGVDQIITAGSVPTFTTLFGDASDPDGSIDSVRWTQVSGPSTATIGTPTNVSTTVNGLIVGAYTFRLTVYDNMHTPDIDDIIINVTLASPLPKSRFRHIIYH